MLSFQGYCHERTDIFECYPASVCVDMNTVLQPVTVRKCMLALQTCVGYAFITFESVVEDMHKDCALFPT